jgi:hypothetical protein
MTSRTKKAGYTAAAVLGLFIGAAGIAAASTGGTDEPAPAPATQTDEGDEADDDGVNCEDGIDTATGNECDGGPAAAAADEANEAPDAEDEAEEAESGDEADDGVDHEFEGEEVGENGDGIPDADDAAENDVADD